MRPPIHSRIRRVLALVCALAIAGAAAGSFLPRTEAKGRAGHVLYDPCSGSYFDSDVACIGNP